MVFPGARRSKPAAALVAAMLVVVGCSSSAATDVAAATPVATTPVTTTVATTPPIATPTPLPTPTVEPVPTPTSLPTPHPRPTPAPTPTPHPGVPQVWFAQAPASHMDFTLAYPVDRPDLAGGPPDELLVQLVQSWLDGPTDEEAAAGFLDPLPSFTRDPACSDDFMVDRQPELVVVTLCGDTRSPGIGADARTISSFERTVVASGLAPRAALLNAGGSCFGSLTEESVLACLRRDRE